MKSMDEEQEMTYHLEQVSIRLVKERELLSSQPINDSSRAAKLAAELLQDYDREVMAAVHLDTKGKPINMTIASIGALNKSIVTPRELLKAAILSNANSMILLHNHPSGELIPSIEDIQVTDRMLQAASIIGISVVDHIIIGNYNQYYSLRENQLMEFPQNNYERNIDRLYWQEEKTIQQQKNETKKQAAQHNQEYLCLSEQIQKVDSRSY